MRERKSGSSHSIMERCGGWHTTSCTGCLEHHGNREREGLREAEVQGLHLFQQHFNYFRRRHLVKQMHSGAPATTGRNSQRFWCLRVSSLRASVSHCLRQYVVHPHIRLYVHPSICMSIHTSHSRERGVS